ncbi:MAG: hypothetical protein GY793_04960 [Proteobacteria bacterium]|nr:hypothetical protein [Pseudomonadota bacterium]
MTKKIKNTKSEHKVLIEQAQQGDEEALRNLLINISQILRVILSRYIILPELREVVLQDILVAVHKSLHTYDFKDDFSRWLFSVIKHRCIVSLRCYDLTFRRRFKYKEFEKVCKTDLDVLARCMTAEKDLSFLSERDTSLLNSFKENELSIKNTAEDLNISTPRLKYRISRIYKAYRKEITKKG